MSIVLLVSRAALASGEHVPIVTAASETESEELAVVLREVLHRIDIEPELSRAERVDAASIVQPPEVHGDALARVWIDLTSSKTVTLYLVDRTWERILIRNLTRRPDDWEVLRESIGQIVESTVEALRSGATIGVSREELLPKPPPKRAAPPPPPPSPPPREPAPPRRAPLRFSVGVSYRLSAFAPELPIVHGPAAAFRIESAGGWGGVLSGQLRVPATSDGSPVAIRLDTIATRLLGTRSLPIGRWALELGAGVGLDLTHVSPQIGSTAGPVSVSPPTTYADAVLSASIGLRFGFVRLCALLDAVPSNPAYTYRRNGQLEEALAPWPVRPGAALELTTP